jgi:hypothetical protein
MISFACIQHVVSYILINLFFVILKNSNKIKIHHVHYLIGTGGKVRKRLSVVSDNVLVEGLENAKLEVAEAVNNNNKKVSPFSRPCIHRQHEYDRKWSKKKKKIKH